jgi:hypothetical protein
VLWPGASAQELSRKSCLSTAPWVLCFPGRIGRIDVVSPGSVLLRANGPTSLSPIVDRQVSLLPDNRERLADAAISDYAPKWTGRSYRQSSPGTVTGEQTASVQNLGILRRSVDPEIVDFRQPIPRRRSWFAASGGFIIAGAFGVVIGLLITGALKYRWKFAWI